MAEHARGPSADDPEDLAEHVAELVSKRIKSRIQISGYTESKGLSGWVAGIGATLLVAFIVGGWSLSNQVSSLQQTVIWQGEAMKDLRAEVAELHKLIERRP